MFYNFCDNICTVWWIEPYYISFPVFGGGGIFSPIQLVLHFVLHILHLLHILLSLVPPFMVWLNSRIFLGLSITAITLILLILAGVWLSIGDDWIVCWHKLFYCFFAGKDGMMSFPNSKLNLGNPQLFYCLHWIIEL